MKPLLLAVLVIICPVARADDEGWVIEVEKEQEAVAQANEDAKAPGITPEAAAEIERQRQESLKKIETIADKRPENPAAQLAVSKSLASVEEAPRAIPYAERGLKLAESSGDPKLVREALLTGSEVYYKAGNYDLARARAQRILKDNPKDKDAMALYMQVKDRGTASSGSPRTGSAGGGAGAGAGLQYAGGGAAAMTAEAPRGPGVAMTSASSLEAQKQIALGWSRMKLDPADALKNFEAAVAADPKGAATRVERSKARLEAGDARGALQDANDAIALHSGFAGGYAARAEANRALGKAEAELLADYEAAAKLDGSFTEAYKTVLARGGATGGAGASEGNAANGGTDVGGHSTPSGPMSLLHRSTKSWGLFALIAALLAAAGAVAATGVLKRRRSGEDDSLPR